MNKKLALVYGIRSVIEAIVSGQHLERVFIQKNLKGDLHRELMGELHKTDTPISRVPIERINKFTGKNHQGVVAILSPVQYHNIDHLLPAIYERGETPFLLILDGITDVRNFGAIARTAECLGVHGIIIPTKGGAQITEDGIKASAGALHHVPVCRVKDLSKVVVDLQESGLSVVACTEKAAENVDKIEMDVPLAVVMGSEDLGISANLLRLTDKMVKIPMQGKIQSLNVSVAAGMILYEVQRQRVN